MEPSETWQDPYQTVALLSRSNDNSAYFYTKRWLDVFMTLVLLILLMPLMLLIAALISLDSPGPIIYIQERVGSRRRSHWGQTFWEIQNFQFYKFRSMVHNADPALHEAYIKAFVEGRAKIQDEAGGKFKLTHDPRVTRVGRILRRTSLDELPQLINVLKGEMSLVGPRPVPLYEAAQYQARHYERLASLPGLTGLWQVKGRCQVTFEEMIEMDIRYVHQQSLWLDIKILLLTIPAVLSGRGAE